MILTGHHIGLYGALAAVCVLGGVAYHLKTLDLADAEAKAKAQETVIAASEKRMADREQQFKQQIAQILSLKSTPATTPQQIVERIPQYFPQLQPTLREPADTTKPPEVIFDAPQAKVLNDTLVDCKICQVERDKLKADLVDIKTTTIPAKDKEIKEWKDAANGGSLWTRTKRIGKWLFIGGAIGYIAAKH